MTGTRPPVWARGEAAGGAVLLVFAVFMGVSGWHLPFGTLRQPGAGFFPLTLCVFLGGLSLAILARGLLAGLPDLRGEWQAPGARRRLAFMIAALLGFVAIVDAAGFAVATFGLVAVMTRAVGGRPLRTAIPFAAGTALATWLVFVRLLRVNLPSGWLWD